MESLAIRTTANSDSDWAGCTRTQARSQTTRRDSRRIINRTSVSINLRCVVEVTRVLYISHLVSVFSALFQRSSVMVVVVCVHIRLEAHSFRFRQDPMCEQ